MKKIVWLTILAVIFICSGNFVFAEMQSTSFRIPTSHFAGGGGAMSSTGFRLQSSTGQSSPLMDADDPPGSSAYELYPGYWYTLDVEMTDCDLAAFAASFGSLSRDENYSFSCDFDADGDVDGRNLFLLAISF